MPESGASLIDGLKGLQDLHRGIQVHVLPYVLSVRNAFQHDLKSGGEG